MLNRVRTGRANDEVTFAMPGHWLPELIERLKAMQVADLLVSAHAAAKRFPPCA